MNKEEKIGQLFMVAAYSNRDSSHIKEISKLIKDYNIGGLCFFQGGPSRQAGQTNYYQSISRIPLLVSIDAEWGLSMRLDSVVRYPKQMTMGAISDNQLIYDFGKETARQLKRVGAHLNFAPVVDVNNNPKNPVINDRSFGEDKYKVAAKGIEYMRGMQDNGVMANAKHFPGHGNTDKDSHLTLPTLNRTVPQLDSIELYPFRELMSRGIV
ncbi:MAG: glycoside hydrolase family 3 protein, partial [bacterium]